MIRSHLFSTTLAILVTTGAGVVSFGCDNDLGEDADEGGTETGGSEEGGNQERDASILAVKAYVTSELDLLVAAALELQTLAPAPDDDGWNPDADGDAVSSMKTAWRDCRISYERVEGAIAELFPDLDASTDERYDGFIEEAADSNLFDDEGVTGVHAIERILWSDAVTEVVEDFESSLGNYVEPAFPATEAEATDFKMSLAQRLVDDTELMKTQFEPLALDPTFAFGGVIGSMEEQLEKVNLAASGEDESRYAQHTLSDMRANLEGGHEIFDAFEPWLVAEGEQAIIDRVHAGFDRISAAYDAVDGDAIPEVPEDWNADAPAADDLATPYGEIWQLLATESDAENPDSLVTAMFAASDALGLPRL